MKRSLALSVTAFLISGILTCPGPVVAQSIRPSRRIAPISTETPEMLVARLYRLHNKGTGPIFDKGGQRYLKRYFDSHLADLLWKNIVGPPSGDVGNLDFDPLYNTQDLRPSDLRIYPVKNQKNKTEHTVVVTFKNYDQSNRLVFYVHRTKVGWRIRDIGYGSEERLVKILSQPF